MFSSLLHLGHRLGNRLPRGKRSLHSPLTCAFSSLRTIPTLQQSPWTDKAKVKHDIVNYLHKKIMESLDITTLVKSRIDTEILAAADSIVGVTGGSSALLSSESRKIREYMLQSGEFSIEEINRACMVTEPLLNGGLISHLLVDQQYQWVSLGKSGPPLMTVLQTICENEHGQIPTCLSVGKEGMPYKQLPQGKLILRPHPTPSESPFPVSIFLSPEQNRQERPNKSHLLLTLIGCDIPNAEKWFMTGSSPTMYQPNIKEDLKKDKRQKKYDPIRKEIEALSKKDAQVPNFVEQQEIVVWSREDADRAVTEALKTITPTVKGHPNGLTDKTNEEIAREMVMTFNKMPPKSASWWSGESYGSEIPEKSSKSQQGGRGSDLMARLAIRMPATSEYVAMQIGTDGDEGVYDNGRTIAGAFVDQDTPKRVDLETAIRDGNTGGALDECHQLLEGTVGPNVNDIAVLVKL